MTLSVDWANKIVFSDASITDVPAAHVELRELEASVTGVLYAPIIAYTEVDIGNGAIMPAIEFINDYSLKFSTAGSYTIAGGNFRAPILPTPNAYVERNSAVAYAVSTGEGGGGSAPTTAQIVSALLNAPAENYDSPGTLGRIFNRVLTVARFLAYKSTPP
jgi:hypothetical protein